MHRHVTAVGGTAKLLIPISFKDLTAASLRPRNLAMETVVSLPAAVAKQQMASSASGSARPTRRPESTFKSSMKTSKDCDQADLQAHRLLWARLMMSFSYRAPALACDGPMKRPESQEAVHDR